MAPSMLKSKPKNSYFNELFDKDLDISFISEKGTCSTYFD